MPASESTAKILWGEDGEKLYEDPESRKKRPSSTTITGLIDKSRPLMIWAANMTTDYFRDEVIDKLMSGQLTLQALKSMNRYMLYKEAQAYHKRVSQEAKDIGTRVHEVAEKIFRFLLINPGEELDITVDEDIEKPVNALIEWIGDHDVRPTDMELYVWSDEFGGYAGTMDVRAYVDGLRTTIDLKAAKGIYEDAPLQVASYDFAYRERFPKMGSDGAAILRLDKVGGFPEYRFYPPDEVEYYINEFGFLCSIWHIQRTRKEYLSNKKVQIRKKATAAKKDAKLPPIMRKLPDEDPY